MGAYHTIDLQLNQKFTLAKRHWDYVSFDRLGTYVVELIGIIVQLSLISCSIPWSPDLVPVPFHPVVSDMACDPTRTADVAAVIMQEGT